MTLPAANATISETWRTQAEVESNGWTLSGAPYIANGIFLTGSEYAYRDLVNELWCEELTIAIEFAPSFDYNDGQNHILWCTNGAKYRCLKSSNGYLYFYSGNGTFMMTAPGSSYGSYWKTGESNTLIFTTRSAPGYSRLYLNGTMVASGSTNWVPTKVSTLHVGARYDGAQTFAGTISKFFVFQSLWDAYEVQYWNENRIYKFNGPNHLCLPMREQFGSGIGGDPWLTPDRGSNGKQVLLGTGTSNNPTFMNPGFDFAGVADEYIDIDPTGLFGNTEETFVCGFVPRFLPNSSTAYALWDTGTSCRYLCYFSTSKYAYWFFAGGVIFTHGDNLVPHWRVDGLNVMIASGTSGNNTIWLNGYPIVQSSAAWTPGNPDMFLLGIWYNKSSYDFDGQMRHFSKYPFKFSKIQAAEMTLKIMGSRA